jgi:ribosomal protein S13
MFFIKRNIVKLDYYKYVAVSKTSDTYFLGKLVPADTSLLRLLKIVKGVGLRRVLYLFSSLFAHSVSAKVIYVSDNFFLNFQVFLRKLLLGTHIFKKISRNLFLKRKFKIYQGLRYAAKLPSRGQRSKTNAGTIKSLRR